MSNLFPGQAPRSGSNAVQRLLWRLLRPRGPVDRWARLGQHALEYTRQAGLWAGLRRAAAGVRHVLPIYVRATWEHLWPRGEPYREWRRRHEPTVAAPPPAPLSYRPLISILTPVYKPVPDALRDTLASVRAQTYDRWELCVVDGGSGDPAVAALLAGAAAADSRVRVKTLPGNLGISGNLNEALAMAAGDFVMVLDHDDLLAPDLLHAVARRLNDDPALDVIYYDEDKVSANGRTRREPWFKPPRWSAALMLSTNVLRHAAMRRQLVNDVGAFDPTMDGAQDWDLALRVIERTQRLAHLPRVGYHWRQMPGSVAADAFAQPWVFAAQQRCLAAHLARQGEPRAQVTFSEAGQVRVCWPVSGALVSIIIPTCDHVALLRACLESLFQQTAYQPYEVVLVDTGSLLPETWAYYDTLRAAGRPVQVVGLAGEFNYAAANNLGAAQAQGACLVFLNNDTECLEPHWLEELVGWAERPDVGVVGAKLIRPDGTIQHAGVVIGLAGHGSHAFDGALEDTYGPFGSSEWYRDALAVTGACLALRRAVFDQLGGYDDSYQLGYSDLELGLRAVSHGLRVIYTPYARLRHHEGATRGLHNAPADVLRAYWQMRPVVDAGDPYFSPHLSSLDRRPSVIRPNEPPRLARLEQILGDFELLYRPIPHAPIRWPRPPELIRPIGTALAVQGKARPLRRAVLISQELGLTGAPLMLAYAAQYLGQTGWDVLVLAPIDGPLRETLTQSGVRVQLEPDILHDARILKPYLAGCSLVVANTILAWRPVLAAKAAQVANLWWVHESLFGQAQARRSAGIVQALAAADRVVFPSAVVARLYTDWLAPARSMVLYNGVDPHHGALVPGPAAPGPTVAGPSELTLVNLASLEPNKGQLTLLQSVAGLPAGLRERTRVFLFGRPENSGYYRRLQAFAARRLQGRVQFMGSRPHAEAQAYLRQADVFVLSSRDEALSISLLEALAAGRAAVATRVGGVVEVVLDEVNGLLVPPDNPAALTAALVRLLSDPQLRRRLGEAGQEHIQARFSLDRFSQGFLRIVDDLMAARQARSAPGRLGAREAPGELPAAYRVTGQATGAGPVLEAVQLAEMPD